MLELRESVYQCPQVAVLEELVPQDCVLGQLIFNVAPILHVYRILGLEFVNNHFYVLQKDRSHTLVHARVPQKFNVA